MARKRSRAAGGNTDSAESTEKYETKGSCPHTLKGVDMGGLKRAMKKKDELKCHGCKRKQHVATQKSAGPSDILICMFCGHIGCGVTHLNHANEHFGTVHSDCHSIVAVVDSWSVRCLQCRLDINLETNAVPSHAVAFLKKTFSLPKPEEKAYNDDATHNNTEKVDKKSSIDVKVKPGNLLSRRVAPILGLENIGNTCYMNSVLQCLAQTPGLVSSLKDSSQSGIPFRLVGGENLVNKEYGEVLPPLEGTLGEGGQLSKAVFKSLNKVKNGEELRKTGIYLENPSEVIRALKKYSSTFYVGEQHDSHELLRFLLEGLKTEDLKRYQRGILNAMSICTASKEVLPKEREFVIAYKKQVVSKELFIDKIFGGSIVSILKCLECGHVTTNYETFMDISLPVESEKVDTIKSFERPVIAPEPRISKHQLKKERKLAKKCKKRKGTPRILTDASPQEEAVKSNSSNGSASESEADVEDNADPDSARTVHDDGSQNDLRKTTEPEKIVMKKEEAVSHEDGSDGTEESYPFSTIITNILNEVVSDSKLGCTVLERSPEPKLPDDVDRLSLGTSSNHELICDMYGCRPDTPTVTYGGSSGPSLNEDFGSCEGGRGSAASSIEQEDWDEANCRAEYSALAEGVEKSLQLNQDNDIIPPEPFEVPTTDVFQEVDLSLPIGSGDDDNDLSIDQSPHNYRMLMEEDCYQSCDVKHDASDEAYENLVEVEIGGEENDEEGSVHLPDENEHSDSNGSVWGTTLSNLPELDNKTYCLEHCLREFFNEEILSGANKIGCTQCTHKKEGSELRENTKLMHTNALKQLLFLKLPKVLTLHLKRFEVVGSRMSKINRKVTFPLELDVAPYTSSKLECKINGSSPRYQLYGLVEHSGHMSSGHYVAYVKESKESSVKDKCGDGESVTEKPIITGLKNKNTEQMKDPDENNPLSGLDTPKWYLISDTHVKEVSVNDVLNAEAYILFYHQY